MDAKEIRQKILDVLKERGPSLPVQISGDVGMSSLFVSAFLSELSSDKLVFMSNMKVGGSPLYFLKGQENMLEKFHTYLQAREKEAFLLLRGKKVLEDAEQEPAIRVALRSLKDFAVGFRKDEKIFWRYYLFSEEDVRKVFAKPEFRKIKKEPVKEKKLIEKPLLELKPVRKKRAKVKEKSEFVLGVVEFIRKQNIWIIEEKEFKKKEYVAVVRINSELGKINFLALAKDKKKITENDLRLLMQKAQAAKLPGLMLYPYEMNKKAQEYASEYGSLLKVVKIKNNNL